MLYLAVLILRERPKSTDGPGQSRPASSSDLQLFAATSIVSIVSDFKSSITFWPVVPYAVSLAASVAYKSLRNSPLAYRRKRAYALFHRSCDVLDELGKAFSSARAVARMATDTMHEVERVAADRSKAAGAGASLPEPSTAPTAVATASSTAAAASTSAADTADTSATAPLANAATSAPQDNGQLVDLTQQPAPYASYDGSPSFFNFGAFEDWVGDEGLFNHFDPSFDLDRIDQAFSANLDPTQPPLTQDWMNY